MSPFEVYTGFDYADMQMMRNALCHTLKGTVSSNLIYIP